MAEFSKIEWCDHTWNPWIGCTKVSAGCAHCYAEGVGKRLGVPWGPGQPRRRAAASTMRLPFQWDRRAHRLGIRYRVFCASLADIFDAEVPDAWRDEVFAVMARTPHLDWIVVTKRLKVARDYLMIGREAGNGVHMPPIWHIGMTQGDPSWQDTMDWPLPNVTLVASVEDQKQADARIPILLDIPAARRGVSIEPMLGPVDLTRVDAASLHGDMAGHKIDALIGGRKSATPWHLNWVVCGGESGPRARPMHPEWARSLRDQCEASGAAFFFKQWGEWGPRRPAEQNDLFKYSESVIVTPCGQQTTGLLAYESDAWVMDRVGKKVSGRLLDGRTHDGMPG